ncbi:hypothetical protein Q2T40_17885 [Winogradskyella maritima]|uniref:Lipoprotein n=1 Tax=Winogradskyella maritima TaxID=1517766 RepID=A0ABV8AE86_9FLAO|nr:hypothetical protein [Winogradskyella maritima]
MKSTKVILCVLALSLFACNSDDGNAPLENEAKLIIKLNFDANQTRLNNLGQPATIPAGNATQTPNIRQMSANYIEFAPNATSLLGQGEIIYEGPETNAGGDLAIDFQQAILAGQDDTFLEVPLSSVSAGNYDWVRVSLSYQEGDIMIRQSNTDITATLASFLGYNNYITSFDLNGNTFNVNDDVLQGFWAVEAFGFTAQGQAPEGATTVPNPLFDTSPVPQGSCVVTGQFENGLSISGDETEDVVVTLSFSINNSFEWTEVNSDGKFEPSAGEQVVDMGLRGLIPLVGN